MLQLRAASIAETHLAAAALARLARPGDIIVLAGEMGAGKTAFAQGFGAALGIEEPMTSPTFTLVHSYDINPPVRGIRYVHHADVYRLDRTAEVVDLGLVELADDGVVLIEWGDVVGSLVGDHLTVVLDDDPDDDTDVLSADRGRLITLEATGPEWASRWSTLRVELAALAC